MRRIGPRARLALIAAGVVLALLFAGHYFALRALKANVEAALGPNGSVTALRLSLTAVEIDGLRVRATAGSSKAKNWPVDDELRAEHVTIEPDLLSLFTDTIVVRRIVISRPYLPILRTKSGVKLLPSLLGQRDKERKPKADQDSQGGIVRITQIELVDGEIDFFDATLGAKPHRIRLSDIRGSLGNLKIPKVDESEALTLRGSLRSAQGVGTFSLSGNLTPATLDSNLKMVLHKVPLLVLEPYFVRAADARIKQGRLNLEMLSTVKNGQLQAPGSMALSGLALESSGSFAGLSRQAAVILLKDSRDQIDLQFTLEGNLDDPKFSLNEQFYTRVGSALAKALGVSTEGLGRGAGGVVEGVGGVLKQLFDRN